MRTPTEYETELARLTLPRRGVSVRYGDEPDQYGELWLPAGNGPHPVAVLLHGGYWRTRYRLDLMNAIADDLCRVGFCVWNLEYRRVGLPGGGWPGTFDDVAAGFGILCRLACAHRLDLGRVAVIGHSAGGHLALWLAARVARPPRLRPALVVGLAPISDLIAAHWQRLSGDAVAEMLGAAYTDAPELYRIASPAALVPLGIRQLIVHGTADNTVPYAMSAAFHAAARASGDTCELLTLPETAHFELIDPGTPVWRRISRRIVEITGSPVTGG